MVVSLSVLDPVYPVFLAFYPYVVEGLRPKDLVAAVYGLMAVAIENSVVKVE